MLMIRPPHVSRIAIEAARTALNMPLRWTAITASHSASVMLKTIRSRRMPATCTRMSIRPYVRITCSTIAAGLDDLVHHLRGRPRVAALAREARAEVVDDDPRPGPGEGERDPPADPAPSSSHQCRLAVEHAHGLLRKGSIVGVPCLRPRAEHLAERGSHRVDPAHRHRTASDREVVRRELPRPLEVTRGGLRTPALEEPPAQAELGPRLLVRVGGQGLERLCPRLGKGRRLPPHPGPQRPEVLRGLEPGDVLERVGTESHVVRTNDPTDVAFGT